MLTVAEALARVVEQAKPLPPEDRTLARCRGCRLAEDVAADADQPPFTRSLVDGFAVRSADLAGGDATAQAGRDDPGRPDAHAGPSSLAKPPRS